MQTKNVDVYLGLLEQEKFIAMLLHLARGNDGDVSEIVQGDADDPEYDVHATFEYMWEGDPETTLPVSRRLVSVNIS